MDKKVWLSYRLNVGRKNEKNNKNNKQTKRKKKLINNAKFIS